MIKSKRLVFILLVLGQVFGVGCSTISIRTVVEIDAPRNQVFDMLADFERYPHWNPYHRQIEGEFKEGAKLTVHVTRPDGVEVNVPPHIIRIVDDSEIVWGGGIKGVFYGEHRFILESTGSGMTILRHDEDFSGVAIGFADLPPDVIADGYHQMNMALKNKLEAKQ